MLRSAIPIGRYLGVEVRVHLSFLLLLALLIPLSTLTLGSPARGLALWCALVFAVVVREIARSIAAAYSGLRLRALYLLPIGGVMAFAPPERSQAAPGLASTRLVTFAGPVANLLAGLLVLGLAYAIDPNVSLLAQPWISLTHILRSIVWLQIVLGAISLLPSAALPVNHLLRSRNGKDAPAADVATGPGQIRLPSFGLASVIAFGLILAGFTVPNYYWLVFAGAFLLMGAQLANIHAAATGAADQTGAQAILVRDVMVTDFILLSSSDTLRSALDASIHTVQEVFPIVRGDRLVGSITRHTIAERLLADGDSYLQGAMRRNLQVTTPTEPLVEALRRSAQHGAGEFIPVLDDGAMVGILTPQSLTRAVQQVKLVRPRSDAQRQN